MEKHRKSSFRSCAIKHGGGSVRVMNNCHWNWVNSVYWLWWCGQPLLSVQIQQNAAKDPKHTTKPAKEFFKTISIQPRMLLTYRRGKVEGPTNNHSIWWCLWVPDLASRLVWKIYISNYFVFLKFCLIHFGPLKRVLCVEMLVVLNG